MSFNAGNRVPKPLWNFDEFLVEGMKSRFASRFLRVGTAAFLENVDLSDPGRPRKRDGYSETRVGSTGLVQGARINGFGVLDNGPNSNLHCVTQSSGNSGGVFVASATGGGQWQEAKLPDGSSFTPLGDDVKVVQAHHLLWILAGEGQTINVVTPSGQLIDLGNTNKSPPVGARGLAWLFSRVWVLGDNELLWSKIQPTESELRDLENTTPSVFDRTLQRIALDPPFAGAPVGLGVWNNKTLLAFYESGVLAINVNSETPQLSSISVADKAFGLSARDAIASVGNEFYYQDQYGNIRLMMQTIIGETKGLIPAPVAYPVSDIVPGRVSDISKTKLVVHDRFVYVFLAIDGASDVNAALVLDMGLKKWTSLHKFANTFSKVAVSAIGGLSQEIFATDGSLFPQHYVFNKGAFSDNLSDITYSEETRAFSGDTAGMNKHIRYIEADVKGEPGGTVSLYARGEAYHDYTLVARKTLSLGGQFPLHELNTVGSDFPLSDSSLPLKEIPATVKKIRVNLEDPIQSDFPLYGASFPLNEDSFPIFGAHQAPVPGRIIQLKIEAAGVGSEFERHSFRCAAFLENPDFAD